MRLRRALLALGVVACTRSAPSPSAPVGEADASLAIGPPVASVAPPSSSPPKKSSPCLALASGEISDDETPSVSGPFTKKEPTDFFEWLEAHGVKKPSALAFLASYFGGITAQDAETYFYGSCYELSLGDKNEPAALCQHGLPEALVPVRGVAYVVRNKRLAVVLDVGLHLVALDWPDARWLDLAVEVKDGTTVVLRDRAPDGSTLVAPPSACVEREKMLDDCEKEWPKEPNPESYAQKNPSGNGESTRFFQDRCALERGPDGKLRISRRDFTAESPGMGYPAKIHDCAGGRAELVRSAKDAMADQKAEWNRSLRFYDKSCGQRGTWAWKSDRFVKQASKAPTPPMMSH